MQNPGPSDTIDLTSIWLKAKPGRWIAGLIAGFLAGLIATVATLLLAKATGNDPLIMVKMFASPWVGDDAFAYDAAPSVLIIGLVAQQVLASFLGFVFSHFVSTNRIFPLLGMGFTWGFFGWVFIGNLMSNSSRPILVSGITPGAKLFGWMAFGLSLALIAVIDPVFNSKPTNSKSSH